MAGTSSANFVDPPRRPTAPRSRSIGDVEPRIADRDRRRAREPTPSAQAHRVGELRVAGGAARDGQLALRQVRRGHAGPPLLRRLRGRRPGRDRSPPSTRVRCSAPTTPTCSRTPASTPTSSRSGRSSPAGRAPALERARRQPRERPRRRPRGRTLRARAQQPAHDRHGARRRRPPHPRLPSQHLGQAVRPAQLRRRPRHRVARLRRGAALGARVPPAGDRRRLLRLPAQPELRASCARSPTRSTPRSWSTWPTSPASSPARSSPATSTRSRTRTSSRRRRTSRCAGRAAASCCAPTSTPSSSTEAARWCSAARMPHVMAAKAVALRRRPRSPSSPTTRSGIVDERRSARRRADAPRRPARHRRHRQPPRARSTRTPVRAHRTPGRVRAASSRASSPTATRSRPTRTAPGTRRASVSARPRSPPSASVPTSSTRSPTSSSTSCERDHAAPTRSGAPSKARYQLAADVADAGRQRCADLLAKFPLYPTIDL